MELTHKRLIFIIRLLVIISVSYLMLLTPGNENMKYWSYGFIALYLLSNLLLSRLPEYLFQKQFFFYGIVLFDVIMIAAGIFFAGMESSDLYLVFFLIVCLATLGSELRNLIVAACLFVFVYGWLLYREGLLQGDMAVSYSLRLPFILVITLFLGYIVDLQTKDKERRLKDSEERYRTFINNLPVGAYQRTLGSSNEGSQLILMNPAFIKMFGYENQENLLRQIDQAYLLYADQRQSKEVDAKLLQDGRIEGYPLNLVRRDGSVFNSRIWARRHSPGEEEVIEGIVIDETELKQAEEALRESEERLRLAGEASYDVIYEWDLNKNHLRWFGDISGNLGYREDEVVSTVEALQQLIHPDDLASFQNAVDRRYSDTEASSREFRIKHKDGSWRYWNVRSLPALDEKGRPEKWIGACTDITSRRELEFQLQQAQKMEAIGSLAGGVAHNFNNMLMAIQGYVSAMLMDRDNQDPDFEYLSNIDSTINKASRLTRDLLGFARGGAYEPRLTDLNDLIHNEILLFAGTRKTITMRESLQEDLWPVKVDQNQIQQVLMNLYLNAAQAMPETGGDIETETKNTTIEENQLEASDFLRPGPYVRISISDNGCGIDKDSLEKIFEPFFSTKKPGRGTGLGLSSVYGIIKNHGGFISAASEKGQGTTFFIYLPAQPRHQDRVEKKDDQVSRPDPVGGQERVLVVDDEQMIVNACGRLLKKMGYQVMSAGSGEEALETYAQCPDKIDLVLLDMIMPGMGGGEVYDKLRSINPRVKVLLSSGFSLNNQAADILARGCNGFIQKPYDFQQLSAKLREVLNQDKSTG